MTRRAIFWDDGSGLLDPQRDLRPIFDARSGGLTTLERWSLSLRLETAALYVPPALEALTAERHGLRVNTPPRPDGPLLVVNGRSPLVPPNAAELPLQAALVQPSNGEIVAAHLEHDAAVELLSGARPAALREIPLPPPPGPTAHPGSPDAPARDWLLDRPWSWRSFRDAAITADLALLAPTIPHLVAPPQGVTLIGPEPPRVDPAATLYPGSILNTESGPIALLPGAVVRPGAIVTGPAIIGHGSTILEHAHIKPNTAIGPVCKVAGEVGGSVFQGHANKAHDGHLGDSWLGEWVNLGAATVNSNLLNTYAEVTAVATPGARRERTGHTFLGCTLGDHVKTAIATRIMTGAVAHTGAMWADHAALEGCVDRFTWATPTARQRFRPDKFQAVARAAMARRRVEPQPAYLARLLELLAR